MWSCCSSLNNTTLVTFPGTVVYREYSTDVGDPYYPVPNKRNKDLYAKYQVCHLTLQDMNMNLHSFFNCCRPWPSRPRVSSLWAGWPATNTSTWTRPSSMLWSSLTLTSRLSTGVATLSDLLPYDYVLHYLRQMFDCFVNYINMEYYIYL